MTDEYTEEITGDGQVGDGEEEAPEIDPSEIDRARMSGWTPQEEFRGDPDRWMPADAWNERTDTVLPILKATNQKLEATVRNSVSKVERLEQQLQATKTTTERMLQVQSKIASQAYQNALNDLRSKQKEAALVEDWDKYDSIQKAQDELKPPEIIEAPPEVTAGDDTAGDIDPTPFLEFREKNKSWYDNETTPEMTGYAHHLGSKLQAEGITDPIEQLKQVEAGVRKAFPDFFTDRRDIATVSDPAPGGGNAGGGTAAWDKLPADAKEQYKLIAAEIPNYSKKDFLEAYNE